MGDAPAAVTLGTFRETIRRAIGEPATLMPDVTNAMVDAVLRLWPTDWASLLARSRSYTAGESYFRLTGLVKARALEYIEWRYGTSRNVQAAIDLLLERVVDEVAIFWLEDVDHRNVVRRAITAARRADA